MSIKPLTLNGRIVKGPKDCEAQLVPRFVGNPRDLMRGGKESDGSLWCVRHMGKFCGCMACG